MKRLEKYLKDHDLSQADFAEQLGVSQPTVCDWINGHIKPSAERLITISRLTRISIDDLLSSSRRQHA